MSECSDAWAWVRQLSVFCPAVLVVFVSIDRCVGRGEKIVDYFDPAVSVVSV